MMMETDLDVQGGVVNTDERVHEAMAALPFLRDGNAPVHQLEHHVCGVPVSLFSDREAEQLAFPFLFLDGINGYRTARDPSISTLDSKHAS